MRSSGKNRAGGRWLLLCVCALFAWTSALGSDSPQEYLNVRTDPAGGVIATARVLFPAGPEIIHSLLTDFRRWPELFEVRMRLVDLQVRQDVVTTDLRIEHALLPGEWKLSPANEGRETYADFELKVAIDSIVPDWLVALATRRELDAHFRIVKEKARARAAKSEK